MNLGEQIKKQRKIHNMSQVELAKLLRVSHQSVSLWENNKDAPDLYKAIELSHIFKISIDELVNGKKVNKNNKLWILIGMLWVISIILTFFISIILIK